MEFILIASFCDVHLQELLERPVYPELQGYGHKSGLHLEDAYKFVNSKEAVQTSMVFCEFIRQLPGEEACT